jgi:hypothetical protein
MRGIDALCVSQVCVGGLCQDGLEGSRGSPPSRIADRLYDVREDVPVDLVSYAMVALVTAATLLLE